MKRLICLFFIIAMLIPSISAFAGDIPEALSYNDDAKVFIGTLKDVIMDQQTISEVKVMPTKKIKGEISLNEIQSYSSCYFVKTEPVIGNEYFFGWLSNNEIYAYEVKSHTDDKISLHITDEFSERIQDYLDEGIYEQAEIDRVNVGRKITLTEYMKTSSNNAQSVTFSLNGNFYDIDVEKFFQFSDNALITDVKNTGFKRLGNDDWPDDILYIMVKHKQTGEYDNSMPDSTFACVSRFCEVDRYSQMMSRLPNCDFTMKWEDLSKLYELLPFEVQKELYDKNGESMEDLAPSIPKKTYTPWVFAGCAVIILLLLGSFFLTRKNK